MKHITRILRLTNFKYPSKESFLELLWLCTGQLIAMLLGILSIKLLSSMGTYEFGKYSLVLSVSALVSAVLYGPAEQGFLRFYFHFANKGVSKTYFNLLYKFLLTADIGCLFLAILATLVSRYILHTDNIYFYVVSGIFIIASVTSNTFNSMLNLFRKRKLNAILQVSERSVSILFIYILYQHSILFSNTVLIFLTVSSFCVLFIKFRILNIIIPNDTQPVTSLAIHNQPDIISNITKFSTPFVLWGATGWMQSSSERWIIAHYLSTSDVGIYSFMIAIANYMIAIPCGITGQLITPIIYKRISDNDDHSQLDTFKYVYFYVLTTLSLVTLSVIITSIIGQYIIVTLGNASFSTYWYLLPVLCVGTGLFHIGQSLTTIGMVYNVPNKYVVPKISAGLFAVISNIILINIYGITGICLSICLTSAVYLLLVYIANVKIKSAYANVVA